MHNTSISGLTIAAIKRSVLTVGSQSGIPNLSNLIGTPTLQWGNQKHLHEKVYNVKNTQTIFLDDHEFKIPCEKVVDHMKKFLEENL